jgi:WhiB family transcriptional regulator, redox-sensing transcriptional regulator
MNYKENRIMPIRPQDSQKQAPTSSSSSATNLSAGPIIQLISGESVELSWQERALCAQTDPEAFFPEKGGSTREAKRVCLSCDVRSQCLEYALAHDERFGIWGGLSERERRRLKRRPA